MLEGEAGQDGVRGLVKRLLPPCETGLFLTREDIARISRRLDVPGVVGERSWMLENLFRLAGQYELVLPLLDQLRQLLTQAETTYQAWADEYPRWTPYAQAWRRRVAATQAWLDELGAAANSIF